MSVRAPKLFQNTAIYSVIAVLQKGISFFLLPLYTAYLTPSDYGVMNVVTTLSSLLSLFIILGLSGAGTRFYSLHPNDENYIKSLWGAISSFVLLNSIFIVTLIVAFHRFLIDPLAGDIKFYPFLFLGFANVLVSPLYVLYQDYLRSRQMGVHYGVNTFSYFIINTILIILFIAVFKKGVIGVLIANLITSVIFFIYVLFSFMPKLKLSLDRYILKPSFRYSLPLVPHLIAGWSAGMLDRLLLNGLKDEKDTGLYSVASQFGNIVNVIVSSFNSAYSPWFFNAYDKCEYDKIRKVGTLIAVSISGVAFVISLFSPEVLKIMVQDEFSIVWSIIPLLCFAYVFQGLYSVFASVLFLEKTKYVFIITISSMIVNILLNILLIPPMGYIGSAIACFVTFFIKSIIALILARKFDSNIQFKWSLYYLIVFALFAMTFINNLLIKESTFFSLGIKLLFVSGILTILYTKYKYKLINYKHLFIQK